MLIAFEVRCQLVVIARLVSWEDQSRDDWLNLLFAEAVQPKLAGMVR